jgi:hypothetical protein
LLYYFFLDVIIFNDICLHFNPLLPSDLVLQAAREEANKVAEETSATASNTTKDDVARLIHLFKEPCAQVHWSNHFGVLNRAQLDARRSVGTIADVS